MAGDRRSATSTLTARVESAVGEELREAAIARWEHSADVFVWRSRRCAEAVLYALLHRARVDVDALAKQRKGLDQLLEHKQIEGALSRETRAQLASLRDFGNIAAHYQLTGGVSGDSAEGVARFLAGMLREFYASEGGDVPEPQAAHIAALTDPARRIQTRHEIALEEERQRTRDLTLRLNQSQRSVASAREAPRGYAAGYLVPVVAAVVIAIAAAFVLGRSASEPSAIEQTQPTLTLADAAPTIVAPAPIAEPSPPPLGPAPLTAEPAPLAAPVDDPPPARIAPPPLQCPRGMTRVPAGEGRAEFCVDLRPVTESEYRSCFAQGGCAHPTSAGPGCNWASGAVANGLAANCISWRLARDYCRAQRVNGDLPSRAEWNALAAPRGGFVVRADTHEWSADEAGDDRYQVRGERGARGFAWASEAGEPGRRYISFRCVVRATRGE